MKEGEIINFDVIGDFPNPIPSAEELDSIIDECRKEYGEDSRKYLETSVWIATLRGVR